MMSTVERFISLQEATDQKGGPLYVINTADQIHDGGGDVNLSVPVGNQTQLIVIPRTWIPIDLTASVPRKFVLDSINFINSVSSGIIQICSSAYAESIKKDSSYNDEASNVKGYLKSRRSAVEVNRGLSKGVTITEQNAASDNRSDPTIRANASGNNKTKPIKASSHVVLDFLGDAPEENATPAVENVEEVSAQFIAWVTKLNTLDQAKATNELRIKGSLTEAEMQYIIDHLNHQELVNRLTAVM
jgi:hypothetical protein